MLKLSAKFNLLKYCVAAILLAVTLYPKFPFLSIPGTYVSIRLEDFLIGIIGIIVFIKLLPKARTMLKDKVVRAIFLFLAIGLISLASAVIVTKTVSLSLGTLHWVRRVEYFIPFFLGLIVLQGRDEKLLSFFIKILTVTIFLAFIYGLGQKYFSWPVIITQNEEYSKGIALRWIPGSHINSTFAGHYDLATFLVLIMPVIITMFSITKEKSFKISLAVGIFAGLWLLTNAISRISIISYLIGSSLGLLWVKKYKYIPLVLIISFGFFLFSSDLLSRYGSILKVINRSIPNINKILYNSAPVLAADDLGSLKRIGSQTPKPSPIRLLEDRSTSIRLNVEWPRALRAFSKNPILGTGYSSITLATDNDFLRLLGEVGLLGFFGFLLIVFRIAKTVSRALPFTENFQGMRLAYVAGISGGLIGLLINSFFIDVFEASKVAIPMWLLIGVLVYAVKNINNEQIY